MVPMRLLLAAILISVNYLLYAQNADTNKDGTGDKIQTTSQSIASDLKDLKFILTPNPSYGYVQITIPPIENELKLDIFTMHGEQLLRGRTITPGEKLELDLFKQPGIYLIQVSGYGISWSERLLIVH